MMDTESKTTLYPKITGNVNDVVKIIKSWKAPQADKPEAIELVGTVKLHGTHGDIVFPADGTIQFQTRNVMDISIPNDNAGFAAFMTPLKPKLFALKQRYLDRYAELHPDTKIDKTSPLIIAGEWIGKRIQKCVAISQLSKRFVIISAYVNCSWQRDEDFAYIHDESIDIYNISRSGFYRQSLSLDDIKATMKVLQGIVDQVERECPFAKTFGVSGIGEGIVWKVAAPFPARPDFWFKTKGPLHMTTEKVNLPKDVDVGTKEKTEAYAKAFASKHRLQQAWDFLGETDVERSRRSTGQFVAWLKNDCEVEERSVILEEDIDPRLLKTELTKIGRQWYFEKLQEMEDEQALEEDMAAAGI